MKLLSISIALVLALVAVRPSSAEEPATIEKAAAVLDLSKFPLPKGVEPPKLRRPAALSYETSSGVTEAFAFVKKTLVDAGWAEAPGGYASDQAASGVFEKEGYRVSVSAFEGSRPGTASVAILNHGNVEGKSLPVPDGSKLLYETPLGPAYLAPGTVAAVADEVHKRLREQEWEPYGSAGDVRFYKRNAVKLGARVTEAPAQGGQTMLGYSTELMSADLPAPEDAVRAQYADSTKELSFDVPREPKEVFDLYREALGKKGWEPVTASPMKERLGESLRFRNPARELMSLEVQTIDGLSRGRLRHQSAEEVEAMLASASKP
ncbi:hypothetical protein [Paludisphaera soli]|uniref:hypothetical protein n=1 Tax=Paludisphaera soli TaxID=2712865 RepID=UPI0013EDB9C6|nr:hypothetical protein [Paludisphaera soli]